MYDVTREVTFTNVPTWIERVKEVSYDCDIDYNGVCMSAPVLDHGYMFLFSTLISIMLRLYWLGTKSI